MGAALRVCACVSSDDANDEGSAPDRPKKNSGWCVDDDAEAIFVPDAGRDRYVVVGLGGATVRMGYKLDSAVLKTLPHGTVVTIDEVRLRRAHITHPLDGWVSMATESGYVILEAEARPTKYKVVFRDGIFIRSAANIEKSRIVKIAPCGTILRATGKSEIYDSVERIEVVGGWVSMRLREDKETGVPLLEALT